jgi:hypothetical protein
MGPEDYPGYGRSLPAFQQSYSLAPSPLPQGYTPGIAYAGSYSYPHPFNQPSVPPQQIPSSLGKGISTNDHFPPPIDSGNAGAEAQYSQKLPDSKSDSPHWGRGLQHFVNLNASRPRVQDEEHDLESTLSSSRWFLERSLKRSHRTMTVDKDKSHRTPYMQILQTRLISTLEEDEYETVTLTINDEPTEKEQANSDCNMRWM